MITVSEIQSRIISVLKSFEDFRFVLTVRPKSKVSFRTFKPRFSSYFCELVCSHPNQLVSLHDAQLILNSFFCSLLKIFPEGSYFDDFFPDLCVFDSDSEFRTFLLSYLDSLLSTQGYIAIFSNSIPSFDVACNYIIVNKDFFFDLSTEDLFTNSILLASKLC